MPKLHHAPVAFGHVPAVLVVRAAPAVRMRAQLRGLLGLGERRVYRAHDGRVARFRRGLDDERHAPEGSDEPIARVRIREQVIRQLSDELPYQATVLVREFKEKSTLTKIVADIIVQRESQKAIVLGERGSMIKKIGTAARADIEKFLSAGSDQPQKVFLELFVKVKPGWRENELQLREYGY